MFYFTSNIVEVLGGTQRIEKGTEPTFSPLWADFDRHCFSFFERRSGGRPLSPSVSVRIQGRVAVVAAGRCRLTCPKACQRARRQETTVDQFK